MKSGASPAGRLDPSPGLIRVWRVWLDRSPPELAAFDKLLSPDESARALRYHFERDRRRFAIARGALRQILGGYLETRPEAVRFTYGEFGKPALAGPGVRLRFNVSHSGEIALVAIARDREVGVDVEFRRPLPDMEQLLTANFSAREIAAFRALSPLQRETAFFACWTRKEAYLKARGGGLSIPLDSFSVSLGPDEPAALLEVRHDLTEPARWRMVNLAVHPDYSGALIAEGTDWRWDCVDWKG